MKRIYIGYLDGLTFSAPFKSATTPTSAEYPQYTAVVGPFRTMRGARFMQRYGIGNPHCQCVSQAEKLAKRYN